MGQRMRRTPGAASRLSLCASLAAARLRFFRNEKRMAAWILLLGMRATLRRLLPGRRRRAKVASGIRMVSVLSMPRTGSTLAKRYLGAFEAVDIAPLQDFETSLAQSRGASSAIVLDKKTDNIKRLHRIVPQTRGDVAFICLVRDPRDQLLSLAETDRHRPVPRDAQFWPYWVHRYRRALRVLRRLAALDVPVALVRYEDLATRPVEVKGAFLAWLGLEAHELDDGYAAVSGDTAVSRREDWKAHEHSRVHSSSVGRYTEADGEIADAIDAYRYYAPARRLMTELGYRPDGPPNDSVAQRLVKSLTYLGRTHTPAPSDR